MNTVGVNFSNDSAAAVVSNGLRIAAIAEERLSRRKHDSSFPVKALSFCLQRAGVAAAEVDAYAFFWNPGRHIEPMLSRNSGAFRHHSEYLYNFPNHLLHFMGQPGVEMVTQTLALERGAEVPIFYVDHHLTHAANAFYNSPFDSAAILTVDGYGERNSTLIGKGEGLDLQRITTVDYPHSIGSFYAALTQYLGFRANSGEGKVMGLASYGDDSLREKVARLVRLTDKGFELDLTYFNFMMERTTRYSPKLVALLGPPRAPESKLTQRHQDIAAALQLVTEDILLHLARLARKETQSPNLCISGGVALNCVANSRIINEAGFERVFIFPASGDQGSSLGAAQYVAHALKREPRDPGEYLDYLGFENTPEEIAHAVATAGTPSVVVEQPEAMAARLISRGKIVGWFQGRSEFGPRALGNRSIIADPRPAETKDILNARVKFREPFRPFAPSCLEESCGDLFNCSVPSPFMLRVYETLPARLHELASITHVDGGARVQTVTQAQNAPYYNVIKEFGKLTGVDCILNTSFNIRGEPIVNNVKEALFCFYGTDMDYVVAGNNLVAKNENSLREALEK